MQSVSKWRLALVLASILCAALLAIAFVASPHACEWGLTVYFWSGVVAVLALAAIPTCLLRGLATWKLALATLAFVALGVAALVGSLVASDMQVLCRLF